VPKVKVGRGQRAIRCAREGREFSETVINRGERRETDRKKVDNVKGAKRVGQEGKSHKNQNFSKEKRKGLKKGEKSRFKKAKGRRSQRERGVLQMGVKHEKNWERIAEGTGDGRGQDGENLGDGYKDGRNGSLTGNTPPQENGVKMKKRDKTQKTQCQTGMTQGTCRGK